MCCCHGDGSGVRHVYHGHSGYCVEAIQNFIVAMAMVVMGDTCVQSIKAIRTIIRLL